MMRHIRQRPLPVKHASAVGADQKVRHAVRRAIAAQSAAALGAGILAAGVAHAQAVTGSIYGQAPAVAGESVTVSSSATGVRRTVSVGSDGSYRVPALPVGTYTVTLMQNGKVVSRRTDETVTSAGGTGVDFISASAALATVTVTATSLPNIDVTSVNSGTVIDAAQLAKLPIIRNAENIALLAPNTSSGSGYFTGPTGAANLVSFGGSSVSENAYYVNGFNTAEPYKNLGGYALPYGAIQEQQTLTGGYSAKYGRSDGGVISQIGKRGTNDWHFGGQIVWEPEGLSSTPDNIYYPNETVPANTPYVNYALEHPTWPGTIRDAGQVEHRWQTVYSAYVGGPIIENKLFFFLAPEETTLHHDHVNNSDTPSSTAYQVDEDKTFKLYGRVDWNITDSNILDLTYFKDDYAQGYGKTYAFDYTTLKPGAFANINNVSKDYATFYIAHFTSYITDALTLDVLYGVGSFQDPTIYGNQSPYPYISNASNEVLPDGTTPNISNGQTNEYWFSPLASNHTHGLRVDLSYHLGSHNLMAGIDDMFFTSDNQGQTQYNPFNPSDYYFWNYEPTSNPADALVHQDQIGWATHMRTTQKAFYLQDDWKITSRLLAQIGVRNDHYTNYNAEGIAFVDQSNQWAPRLGLSWDVNGDSSFKIYGNAGRYYLAEPDNVAERAANPSWYLINSYHYTGVDANGQPTGLTLTNPDGSPCTGCYTGFTPDGETGGPKDPEQVTARNLKPEYVDEFIVGFDKRLVEHWTYGAKAMYRNLGRAIDDECSPGQIAAKMTKMGLNASDYYNSLYGANYCRLINPGETNTMLVTPDPGNADGVTKSVLVPMTQQDWGYKQGVKRRVMSVDLYLEHAFDGKWQGRVDYSYTHGYGNTEGQVRSDFGQADVSKTEDWDSWQLMDGQEGALLNTRKHQIRLQGYYQLTRQFSVSGTVLAQSGLPQECLGYYGKGASSNDPASPGSGPNYYAPGGAGDPTGYNNYGTGNYHWCNGQFVPPGSDAAGYTPWTFPINLGVSYKPDFAAQRLEFRVDVFNLFNQQEPAQTYPSGDAAYDPGTNTLFIDNTYHMANYLEPPRTVRLTLSYNY